jgi:hypothetical protein
VLLPVLRRQDVFADDAAGDGDDGADRRAMIISCAPWVKIQRYLDAFGERHPDFASALDNVKCALDGKARQYVSDGYIDPPV